MQFEFEKTELTGDPTGHKARKTRPDNIGSECETAHAFASPMCLLYGSETFRQGIIRFFLKRKQEINRPEQSLFNRRTGRGQCAVQRHQTELIAL